MCGITGYYSSSKTLPSPKFYDAHLTLAHRGPDDEGLVALKDQSFIFCKGKDSIPEVQELPDINSIGNAKLYLGHRRLSIIDLSEAGHQPFYFDGLAMVFNGEIFNYKALKKELLQLGYHFETQSDTEVLLKAYHCWRNEAFNKLNGMWSLAIYDLKNESLVLCRDRFGIKPLFYTEKNQAISFASEMKFLHHLHGGQLTLNKNSAQHYLKHNQSSFSTATFWNEIQELEPAHYLIYKKGQIQKACYWNFKPTIKNKSPKQALDEFTALFEDALKLRMQSDVEVGSLLSGGLDSTTIVCALQRLGYISNNNFKSFSGVHEEAAYTETNYIKDTVQQTGLNADYISTFPEQLMEDLPKLNWHIEEPFRSMAVYTQHLIYRRIGNNSQVKVVLNGQGADELFGGYNEQYLVVMAEYLKRLQFGKFRSTLAFLKKERPQTYQRIYRLAFLKRWGKAISTPSYFNQDGLNQVIVSPLREYFKYDDRNSMTYGIEARAPFMDYRLVEFGLSLSSDHKIQVEKNKKIVRDYADDLIPSSVRLRKDKMGFTTPQAKWQRETLANEFDQVMVQSTYLKSYFDDGQVGKAYQKYQQKGTGDFYYFWRVFNFYHWLKRWHKLT